MVSLREVMAKDPVATEPDATVAEAAAAMVRGRVGSLLVEADGSVIGIITERDVLRAAGADGDLLSTQVRDWMARDPVTAPADQDTDEALATMLDNGFRHLPVMDGEDLVGIVSLRDLLGTRVRSEPQRAVEPDTGTTDPAPTSSPSQVQQRREQMFEATRMLQRRSRPPEGDLDQWRTELSEAVDLIEEVVAAHIAGTEQAGGFFEELVRESGGRLSSAVKRLGRDHEHSTQLMQDLRAALDAQADPAELGQAADELFAQLEAHRHRGADLLWQAYGQDIGGED